MLKAYNRLHEAIKRLIILGHILWYAFYINKTISKYNPDEVDILISILGPPVFTLLFINAFYFVYDRIKKS